MEIPTIFARFAALAEPITAGDKARQHESVIVAALNFFCFITTSPLSG
jgi:hypothetical protein